MSGVYADNRYFLVADPLGSTEKSAITTEAHRQVSGKTVAVCNGVNIPILLWVTGEHFGEVRVDFRVKDESASML